MTEPTPAQLDALLDRAERHALSHAEAELLSVTVRRLVEERDTHAHAVQRVRDLHRPWTTVYGTHCNACSRLDITGTTMTGRVIDMPCPTIRALDAQPEPAADTDTARGRT
ncbi:hypothetical protein [Embleya sp. NPDC005971]|uniref:hypothetical protein n=1 Tax=Embleya sp. NPDC005971 TaxID=3156724 RepID=UPI0033DFB1B3